MTSFTRRDIVATRFRQYSSVMEPQISFRASTNAGLVAHGCFRRCRFIRPHRVSIGDRSGLPEGQGSTGTSLLASHAILDRAVWHVAPSCWYMNSPYELERGGIDGIRWFWSMFWYFSAFILPSTIWSEPTPCADMHPQTITDAGNFTFRFRQFETRPSVGRRITRLLVSPNEISNLDSSLQMMESHCLCVQFTWSFAHFSRRFFCSTARSGLSFCCEMYFYSYASYVICLIIILPYKSQFPTCGDNALLWSPISPF